MTAADHCEFVASSNFTNAALDVEPPCAPAEPAERCVSVVEPEAPASLDEPDEAAEPPLDAAPEAEPELPLDGAAPEGAVPDGLVPDGA